MNFEIFSVNKMMLWNVHMCIIPSIHHCRSCSVVGQTSYIMLTTVSNCQFPNAWSIYTWDSVFNNIMIENLSSFEIESWMIIVQFCIFQIYLQIMFNVTVDFIELYHYRENMHHRVLLEMGDPNIILIGQASSKRGQEMQPKWIYRFLMTWFYMSLTLAIQ